MTSCFPLGRAFAWALTLPLLAVALGAAPHAQPDTPRWGNVPDEDLAMTTFAADPSAAAVVLFDVGHVEFEEADDGFRVVLRRHRRVKVLTEAGYEMGSVVIRFDGDGRERVDRVRGQTFVPAPGGRPRRVELQRNQVFTSEVGEGYREVRFTLPALQPGAVFEYSYELMTPNIVLLPTWYFQDEVPVRYSAFEFEMPEFLGYASVSEGAHPIETGERSARSTDLGDLRRFWWIGRDLPALPEEPYVAHLPDHLQQVQMQLQSVVDPEFGFREGFLGTWQALADALLEHPQFGRRLEGGRRVRQEAERLAAAHATPAERLRAAYDFVRTTVVWDRHYDVFADRSADDVLAAGRGSSAEVNLLLLAVLRAMGLEATPILLSTRSNGRPLPLYPLLSQFNHVVVLAAAGGSPVLLDATDRDLPAGLLPIEALAGMGWRVDHSDPSWITFQPLDRTGTVAQVTGALAPDGTASGTLSFRLTGYAAGKARARLRETATDGPAAPVAELVEAPDGAEIDSVAVVQADDVYEPVDLSASFRLQGAAESIGDRLYLTPVLFGRHRESPFGLVERTYPVEFGHPFSQTYSAQIELPEGYEVEALPPALSRNLPGQSARYARSVTVVGRALHVQMRFEVRTPTFEPAAYPALRALFDEMVAADAEPIVLRPIAAEAAPSADAGGRP